MRSHAKKVSQFSEIKISTQLKDLNKSFKILDTLNNILKQIIPPYLHNSCHIGAIDDEVVVLFVSNQAAYHLLRNFSDIILNKFSNNNFDFKKILIKLAEPHQDNTKVYRGKLNNRSLEKLKALAQEIGKPELIQATTSTKNLDEDELII